MIWGPTEDLRVRHAYIYMDFFAGDDGEGLLNKMEYGKMLQEATSLGLKATPHGFEGPQVVNPDILARLNGNQTEGLKIARDVCETRRANKAIARERSSPLGNLGPYIIDLLRSRSLNGFACDHFENKYEFNATKIVGSAKKTNDWVTKGLEMIVAGIKKVTGFI